MINKIWDKTHSLFSDKSRDGRMRKNSLGVGSTKIIGILISLLNVSLVLDYVDTSIYGIWLALSSIISWFSFFDIGLNNGLRNQLGASLAVNDINKSKQLVSTTYFLLSLIFLPLMIILIFIAKHIKLSEFLNISSIIDRELFLCTIVIIVFFCIRFILSTINIIAFSDQRPALASLQGVLEQVGQMVAIIILMIYSNGNLLLLSVVYCFVPILILLLFNLYLFSTKYKLIRPSINSINLKLTKGLFRLGVNFFVIQIAGILLFQTSNFIVIRCYGAEDVTDYNISYKYFSVLTVGMGIMTTPLWSAITNAYSMKDYSWIKKTVNRTLRYSFIFSALGFIMLLISPFVYDIWLSHKVKIPLVLSCLFLLFNISSIFGGVYCSFLNGCGMLKAQFWASVFSPIIFLVLCFLFIEILSLGVYSVVLAIILSNFNSYLISPIMYYKWARNVE